MKKVSEKLSPVLLSRSEALAKGFVRFFTGKPCVHGHVTERYTRNKACLGCSRTRDIKRHKERPEKFRAGMRRRHLFREYGLSVQEFDDLVKVQKGKCAICKKKVKLVVDHCHSTGRVRGLLCSMCNGHLGFYEKYQIQCEIYLRG